MISIGFEVVLLCLTKRGSRIGVTSLLLYSSIEVRFKAKMKLYWLNKASFGVR